ncbi:uncharacterized protein CHAB577_0290 [Chlamydia abortus]|nr:uncharacterized protein CHAB577_0290 [Chlamydia abortus]
MNKLLLSRMVLYSFEIACRQNKKVCFGNKQTFLDSLHLYFSIQAKDFVFLEFLETLEGKFAPSK